MKNFKIVLDLINKLMSISDNLVEKEEKDAKADGYNCAVSCIKSSIKSRVEYLLEMIDGETQETISEVSECYDTLNSMIQILQSECKEESGNLNFDIGFCQLLSECLPKLTEMLKKYECLL